MKRTAAVAAAVAALAAPATASAGGLGAYALGGPPAGIRAGETWLAQVRVVACMGQPVDLVPSLTIVDSATARSVTFRARPTGRTGVYAARVVFPSAGRWSYRAKVGEQPAELQGPFAVAPAQREPNRLLAALPPLGAVVLVLATGLALRRRRT